MDEKELREFKKSLIENSGFTEDLAEYIADLQNQLDELKQRVSDLENPR